MVIFGPNADSRYTRDSTVFVQQVKVETDYFDKIEFEDIRFLK